MMKAAILALLLGATLVIGLACDGGEPEDTLTLEEYILEVSCLTEEAATTAADYWDQVNLLTEEGDTPEPTSAQAVRDANLAFWDKLATLEPPDIIKDAHEQLIEFGREGAKMLLTERPPGFGEIEARFEEARDRIDEAVERAGVDFDVFSGDACQASRTPTP